MSYLQAALLIYFISIPILVATVIISISTLRLVATRKSKSPKLTLLWLWFKQKNETIVAIGSFAIFVLTIRFIVTGDFARVIIAFLVFLFSLAFLRFAILNRKIWHEEYRR